MSGNGRILDYSTLGNWLWEADIRLGDTMARPAFLRDDDGLSRFDLVTANPMWNQTIPVSTYENDPYYRFGDGIPPGSSVDWGWVQHMFASLKEGRRMAVVLDTGAVSRGSGNQGSNRERDICKAFVAADRVEAVILLPENLLVNTTAPSNGVEQAQTPPGPDPFDQRLQTVCQGLPQELPDRRAH